MTPKVAFDGVTKRYGSHVALDDFSVAIREGCVFGLLGRNGAGKTTSIGCALGLLRPSAGSVRFNGKPLSLSTLDRIAYVPETPAVYGWMTGEQHVEYWKRLYRSFDVRRARELRDLFEIPLTRRVRRLSKGQKTALALLLAFAQRAEILVLDEPSSGLDPLMQRRMLDLIVRAGADGITVLFSSHNVAHVECAAEEIGIIDRGRLVLRANLDDVRENYKTIEATFDSPPPSLDAIERMPGVRVLAFEGVVLRADTDGNVQALSSAIQSMRPASLRVTGRSLEQVFLSSLVGQGDARVV